MRIRASVLPFQKCVNSVSGFANSVFYRFRFAKFRFLPFQIFKIPFHFFQTVFLLSIIFVFKIVAWNALPQQVRSSDSVATFRSRTKTHLFRLAY